MAENWTIEGETREERIETAVNTILGMSLISEVEIGARVASSSDGSWFAYVLACRQDDNGLILCPTEDDAHRCAAEIYAETQRVLKQMPPFGLRRPITLRESDRAA